MASGVFVFDKSENKKLRVQFRKLLIIILAWVLVGFLITVYDHLSISSILSAGYSEDYSFVGNLTFNLVAAFIGASLGGSWLVFYINEYARKRSYGFGFLMVLLSFLVIIALIVIFLGVIKVKVETGGWPFGNSVATKSFYDSVTDTLHLKNMLVWAIVVLVTQFVLQMNDKFGQGLLWEFIRGKYNQPKEEMRIFMFLDLIGSTSMAEKLGNKKYYSLLREFFSDITNSIIYNNGKIYQYAGDEIIVSWKYDETRVDHDCIQCYFDVREAMDYLKEKYQNEFGVVPDFKAAIHYGDVTAGEIGVVKKELTYSGDVLNTTARIMAQCKVYGEKLLISEKLRDHLQKTTGLFSYRKVGEELLRGKSEKIHIYKVQMNSSPTSVNLA